MKKAPSHPAADSDDFKNMVNLLSVFTAAHNALTALESSNNETYLELVDEVRDQYAELQKALTEAETALEIIARKHPEWFTSAQTLKTPYGAVKFHASTKLVVENPEVSILLIKHRAEKEESAMTTPALDRFRAETYIRSEEKLNLEALDGLTDPELHALRIKRVPTDNFSVKPAAVDMGKAVKEAAEIKEAA